jgi:AraC-like DNA-binding protein
LNVIPNSGMINNILTILSGFKGGSMRLTVSSIKMKEIIAPGHTLHLEQKANNYAYFEILDTLETRWKKRRERLKCGQIVVGRGFKLHNSGSRPAAARGVTFRLDQFPFSSDPYIIKERPEHHDMFSDISELFDMVDCHNDRFHKIERVLPLVLAELGKRAPASEHKEASGKIDRRLILVNRYIRNHFQEALTLQLLADLIQCNPIYLSNTYSKVFKISPIRYIQNLRMAKAKILLTNGSTSVGEIANQLGYISGSQFAELFKRYYNTTPSQYRLNYHMVSILHEGIER